MQLQCIDCDKVWWHLHKRHTKPRERCSLCACLLIEVEDCTCELCLLKLRRIQAEAKAVMKGQLEAEKS